MRQKRPTRTGHTVRNHEDPIKRRRRKPCVVCCDLSDRRPRQGCPGCRLPFGVLGR